MAGDIRTAVAIRDDPRAAAGESDEVSVGDVVDALAERGYGRLLFVPALIEVSPIGGAPAVPTILALLIALFTVQIALGREAMWLPGSVRRWSVSAGRMRGACDGLQPTGRWFHHRRLPRLASDRVPRGAAVLILALCLTVPPPFASRAPMATIACLGLAMMLRDGLLMAAAFLVAAAGPAGLGLLGGG